MSEVGTNYWSNSTDDLFKGCEWKKDFWGNKVIENDRYKVKVGRFVNGLFDIHSFSPCYKGYKKIDGKWLFVCVYFMSSVNSLNQFLHQMEYEYEQPNREWPILRRMQHPETDI